MRRILLALALAGALAGAAFGQDVGRRMLADAEAPEFRGVGRLNVAGRRFCTATLISERVVVTAAHCLFRPRSGRRVALAELRFVAGLRRGRVAALRGVAGVSLPPDFVFSESLDLSGVRADIALVALDAPVAGDVAPAFEVGEPPRGNAPVAIVSYARDRAQAASIEEDCRLAAGFGGVAAVDCAVDAGASGAPVFAGAKGARRLVAVVSAMGRVRDGAGVTLAVVLAPRLTELTAALEASGAQ